MDFTSDLTLLPNTPQLINSIRLNSPRLKIRSNFENIKTDKCNITEITNNDMKSFDKNSFINIKMIEKEIQTRKNCLESQENKIQVYNEILEQSPTNKDENNTEFSKISAQFGFSTVDSRIDFDKKLVQKIEYELEMLQNLKNINQIIEKDINNQKYESIIRIRNQFLNYIENDNVTEIDENNINEKIEQLKQILSDFYAEIISNNDLNGAIQSHSMSPRRIYKKLKKRKQESVIPESLQPPKQSNHLIQQNQFIMRPNNSKIIYNSSLKDGAFRDHQMIEEKNIKFGNKNFNSESVSTSSYNDKKNKSRPKRKPKQQSIQSNKISLQSLKTIQINNMEQISDNKKDENQNISAINIDLNSAGQISEPSNSANQRNSPRRYQKKNTLKRELLTSNNYANNLLDLNQSSYFRIEGNGKTKTSENGSTSSKSNSNSKQTQNNQRETTGSLLSTRANGLLNAGNDGSSDSDPQPPPKLNDHQRTGCHRTKKKPISLFDFITDIGNIIINNMERAIGKQRNKPKKPSLSSIIDTEALKKNNINADEIIGLDFSSQTDNSDSDYDYGYGYGYDSDELDSSGNPAEGQAAGKGRGKDKIKSKHGKHDHGKHDHGKSGHGKHDHGKHDHEKYDHSDQEDNQHHNHSHRSGGGGAHKVNDLNGLTKQQEEEMLKAFENGGEIPKGYAVLVGKNGEKVIVQTVYGIEDENDNEGMFVLMSLFDEEMQLKDMEEADLRQAKREKVNKKHRGPPEFEYEVAEDEDFRPIIRRRLAKHQRVIVEREGRKFDEKQRKPIESFEYVEVDIDVDGTQKVDDSQKVESFDSAPRTKLVKRFIKFELLDVESEGGTIREAYVPIPPNVEYEWVQEKEDPTTIGKYPKQWGYKWTYGRRGERVKVCFDKRSVVEEQSRDWKGNPITIYKKVRMEVVEVDCDDGVKRKIRRPIQKVEFELFEVENDDGTFSIVKRPIIFTQLENGTWKRVDSESDFYYELVEINGKLTLEKRQKVYELVDVECDDGQNRKVKREVEPIEYEEVIDEATGKKKIVLRKVRYGYVIIEDENGNQIRARREILDENEKYEYIGTYDDDGNFTIRRQRIRYGYRYDFNGHRIRYRLPDEEIIEDEEGNQIRSEIQYEIIEVELDDGRKVKVLRRKDDYEYVMETDEKTGETKYVRQKVQYKTITKTDDNGNVITVKTKVTQDFDEVADGFDANGNVVYKKVAKEYETITMKNSKGEVITVKRARRYNYETVVDANGQVHQVRKEKVKPLRVRKAVKRLVSFPKPPPRSKSFSYLRRYPKHVETKSGGPGGVKPSTSIANLQQVIQILKRNDNEEFSDGNEIFRSLRNDREFYRKILLEAYSSRVKKTQLDIQLIDLQVDLATARAKSQSVQDDIEFVKFEIRSKQPRLSLSKPNQVTVKKPPIDGSDVPIQTVVSMAEMNDFHKKVRSGMLTNKQLAKLGENNQTLLDYLDKLHRDQAKAQKILEANQKEGDEYLATIRIYKPTPDSIAMPPETRRKLELKKNFTDLDVKYKQIQKELQDAREALVILKRQQQDKECLNEIKKGKVDTKKKVPKISLTDLKKFKSDAISENRKAMSRLRLAEIEERNLDQKLEFIVPNYSLKGIEEINENIAKMKKTITMLKKKFRLKRKIPDEQAKHSYAISTKEEIAEFEKRRKMLSKQITSSIEKEKELIDNINGMARVMKKDRLRIPMDRLVTIFE